MEKNSVKISLGTAVCMFIIFLLIIAVAIVYYFGFVNNSEEVVNTNIVNTDIVEDTEENQNANVVNKDVVENTNKSNVSEDINDSTNNNETKFSDDEIKKALQNYLSLIGTRRGSSLGMLVKLGLCDYGEYDYATRTEDGYVQTNIKDSTYKEKMLEYVTEEWFNTSCKNTFKVQNGMLYYFDGGASGFGFEVKDITLKGDYSAQAYIAQVYIVDVDDSKELINVEFHIANNNGKCVISYCDWTFPQENVSGNDGKDAAEESTTKVDVVQAKSYGEPLPLEGVAFVKDGYLYYSYNNSEEAEKITGVSNIKSLDIFNIGTGINKVPFVVTNDGVVYRLNSAKKLVIYEELSKYKVDKIVSHVGEMYDTFTLLLLDGTVKIVQVK